MNWFKSDSVVPVRSALAAMLLATCAACSTMPAPVDTNVKIDFPPEEQIACIKQADAVLDRVSLSRAQIDWRYRQKEQICFDKFFMNHCLSEAKTERHDDLARIKRIEVAANYFKRAYEVQEMDKSLAERNRANPLPVPNPGPMQPEPVAPLKK